MNLIEDLNINSALARQLLTGFIKEELAQVGFKRAVIGLSGGIDSALAAYLAAEALGAQNVLCVRMPYRSSSPESLEHAGLVIEALGTPAETVEITPMVEPLFERFPQMDNMRKGNIMARQRMIILYDQSAAFDALVVGTSNKTEALLGYSTLFGDSAAALHPLADLYKYQVRQLARAMDVPAPIIDKPPSADLWPGQTDEGELGYSYDAADQVLYLLVDRRFSPEECIEAGAPRTLVERIWSAVRRSHYKRRMPLTPKISGRSLGHDFLYLRDWGAAVKPREG